MRKKTSKTPEPEKTTADYYDLKTQAVEDLVTADESNSPKVSEEELKKYRSGPKIRMPDKIRVILIKWWFAAAVCFFFLWGLGNVVGSTLDLMFITAIALGFVTDLLTNNVIRFLARKKHGYDVWMMYPKKGYISLPLNVLHAGIIMLLVFMTYNLLNAVLISGGKLAEDAVPLGVEPILFGLLCMAYDMLLIGCKRVMSRIVLDAKRKAAGGR